MNKHTAIILALLIVLIACNDEPAATTGKKLEVGQVWKYHNRPGEDSSTLTILKIEYYPNDTIIHIRIDGVNIYSLQAASGYTHSILHLPYSQSALLNAITELTGKKEQIPDFREGYTEWKKAWDVGKAGYFRQDIKEIVQRADNVQRPR